MELAGQAPRSLLERLVLLQLPAAEVDYSPAPPYSYPAFGQGWFAGVEFPVAFAKVEQGELAFGSEPGKWLEPGQEYAGHSVVVGSAAPGSERRAFKQYVRDLQGAGAGVPFNYNSWWTTPVPFSKSDCLDLLETFYRKLYERTGQCFDTFTVDMGWSNPRPLWELDTKLFPDGFARLKRSAERMKTQLGLWVSPSAFYPRALDTEWAKEQGYETQVIAWGGRQLRLLCQRSELPAGLCAAAGRTGEGRRTRTLQIRRLLHQLQAHLARRKRERLRRHARGLHKAFEALGRVRVQAEVAALEGEAELLILREGKQTVPPFEAVVIRANGLKLAC